MTDESIFAEVIGLEQNKQQAFLEDVCRDQAQMERVSALLEANNNPDSILEVSSTVDRAESQVEGESQIGPYKLREQIGEGGMGVVYVAEQEKPVRRKVALKIIKPGMDSKDVVARFEAERQALAMMNHPNIAKVLDAGTTDEGRPYFVMELVKGIPVTDYCDQSKLSVAQRLSLFVQVCKAVQHAHQKGIIHRDIKPTNVLVTLHDGEPVPKVIDFGVAKAINQRLTDRTIYTRFAQVIGTPMYMSPEQAELSGLDVDTRADIYALGVLLYELLTGTPPFDRERLSNAAFDEWRRIIREEEPPKPSTRLSTIRDTIQQVSSRRASTPDRLASTVRGDLDWIVMKALEKDRTRRFQSAAEFAEDVTRYQADEPIQSRPPSTVYQLRKLFAKHKATAFTLSALLLLLIAGSIGTSTGWLTANRRTAELEKSMSRLREAFISRAMEAAFSGELETAREAIKDATLADTDPTLTSAIEGLALFYSGESERAIEMLRESTKANPDNATAWSALRWANYYNGEYDKMGVCLEELARIKEAGLLERSEDDGRDFHRLLYAQTQAATYPEEIEGLNDLISRHRGWGIAYAIRGHALDVQARRKQTINAFEKSLDDFKLAAALYPDSVLVNSEYLNAATSAMQLATAQNDLDNERRYATLCKQLDKRLCQSLLWKRASVMHRSAYYKAAGLQSRYETTVRDYDRTANVVGAYQRQLGLAFANQNADRLAELLATQVSMGGTTNSTFRLLGQIETSGRTSASLGEFREIAASIDPVHDGHVIMLAVPLLAGDLNQTSEIAKQFLGRRTHFTWVWYPAVLKYLGNPTAEAEEAMLSRAGPFSSDVQAAHYHVGMVALARGDREKARRYFTNVVETGKFDWAWHVYSAAFLKRMETDENWPSWIRESESNSESRND